MKILILQDYLRSGGTERQSVLLANAFAAAGHASTLLTFRPGGALDGGVAPNVTRASLQSFDLGLDWFAPRLHTTVTNAAPDVVLCMGRMANCRGASVQRAFRRQGSNASVIATMRTGKNLPSWFQQTLIEVPHIVANSRDARDTLIREYRIAGPKISVIHNSLVFPPEASLVRNEALRREHAAGADTQVMVCVAMFRPEKNQRELIEIVARLPVTRNWQLWLAGEGPARAACEQRAATLGVLPRVRFLGFHANPSAIYCAADIAVHASWSEALSNFLIEAQAHGLPAVAYEAQGIRECFVPDHTGWAIPRNDHEAFCAALVRLMTEPAAVRAERSTIARQAARQSFDPARQVAAYLDLFQRLRADTPPS